MSDDAPTDSLQSVLHPDDGDAPPNALTDRLADTTIVGLGEATHGTRECFEDKAALLRWLVTEADVRLIGLESNYPETLAVNDYVVDGRGDPATALAGTYFWTWQVESLLDFLEWLRSFNADRPRSERVRFHGLDAQFTSGAVSRLRSYFEDVDEEYLQMIDDDLHIVDDGGSAPDWSTFADEGHSVTERIVESLRERLDEHRDVYLDRSSDRSYRRARDCVETIERSLEYRTAQFEHKATEELAPLERSLAVRDRAMADTAERLLDDHSMDCLAIWAHDAHINAQRQTVRGSDVDAPSMGSLLADRYGQAYVPIGYAIDGGRFRAIDASSDSPELAVHEIERPPDGTLAAAIRDESTVPATLDVDAATQDDRLAGWLDGPLGHLSVGATYEAGTLDTYVTPYRYTDAFAFVRYVGESSPSRLLSE